MIRFECDYAEGMHPAILDALIKTNEEQTPGYAINNMASFLSLIIIPISYYFISFRLQILRQSIRQFLHKRHFHGCHILCKKSAKSLD